MTFEGEDVHRHASLSDNRCRQLKGILELSRAVETGASTPYRNEERMLSRTNIPVASDNTRRLDLDALGLDVCHGLPLLCDATVLTPISAADMARPGASNQARQLLRNAEEDNNDIYRDVLQ